MSYNPVNWVNGETPINDTNLNNMDRGISDAHSMLEEHERKIDDFVNQQLPEEYVKEAVDTYVENNSAGFATAAELEEVESQLDSVNSEVGELSSEIADVDTKFEGELEFGEIYKSIGTNYINEPSVFDFSQTFCGFALTLKPIQEKVFGVKALIKCGADCDIVCEIYRNNAYSTLLASCEKQYTKSSEMQEITFDFADGVDTSVESKIQVVFYVKNKSTFLYFANMRENISDLVYTDSDQLNYYLQTTTNWTKLAESTNYSFVVPFEVLSVGVTSIRLMDIEKDIVSLSNKKENVVKMNYLYVSNDYNENTVGWGVTHFKDIWSANVYLGNNKDASFYNRYTIIVKQGTYTDLQERYSGVVGSYYIGVQTLDYVYYESEDINRPDLCVIEWDGAIGHTSPTYADVVNKCPFHIIGHSDRGNHTHIKGFTFRCKNLRYCFHTETQSMGIGSDWVVENCVFEWGGCPDVSNDTGQVPVIGMGSSPFEIGTFKKCKVINTQSGNNAGIQNHNNRFSDLYGYTPFMVCGANITIDNCDLGGKNIEFRSGYDNLYNTPSLLTVKGTSNVNRLYLGFINGASEQNWKVEVMGSDVTSNEV